ncbi:Imm42 family immunity protein [Acinetobacter pittii]|uniref:Imm42 family immunity protein n=1 Tax=Acinetobacter pittii TaxID=48296 RepID=UPI002DB686C9|nr:Imm42 family immunity protein [Acinetobacter pittii]MEB7641705.1 immunity 42 family protein [Acinetobacter pittii]
MIFGNKDTFALFIEPILYIKNMRDYDCFCGFYIKGKKYGSESTQMLYTQKESISGGALCNIFDSENYFFMDIKECFKEMLSIRYLNFIAESEAEYMDKDWVDYDYNEFVYSANLESSLFGEDRYDLFCIGYKDDVRLISYKIANTYFSLKDLKQYEINECFIKKNELEKIVYEIEHAAFN